MIIDRYVRREIIRPLIPILGILVILFASFSAATLLGDAVSGLLPAGAIARLVALKTMISLEVLIPIALYLSVVVTLSRFSSDGEFVAASALRVTPGRVQVAVISVSATLALLVAALSLVGRPWAYGELNALAARAGSELNADAMRPGTFYVSPGADRVIFYARQEAPGAPAHDVFLQIWHGDRLEIIHASTAFQRDRAGPLPRDATIVLQDAHAYEFDPRRDDGVQILRARTMVIDPDAHGAGSSGYDAVKASTRHLLGSVDAADAAERQWRFSTPISTLLLGLLGIPMSRGRPGQNRYATLATAIGAYFVYYMLFSSARTWVQHGAVASFPGLWWVPASLAAVLAATSIGRRRDLAGGFGRA